MITDELKILRFVISHQKLVWKTIKDYCEKENINSQNIWDNYFDETLASKPRYFTSSPGFWILTREGKEQLEHLEERAKEKNILNRATKSFTTNILPSLLVGVIVTFVSVSYTNYTNEILAEKYEQVIQPTPESLDINIGTKELSAQKMSSLAFFPGDEIEICITNLAKMRTDYIRFELTDEILSTTGGRMENIGTLDKKCEYVKVFYKNCRPDVCNADESSIPNGKTALTFEFKCRNCYPNIFNKTFDICIWHENNSICKI